MKRAIIVISSCLLITILAYSMLHWDDTRGAAIGLIAVLPAKASRPVLERLMESRDDIIAEEATYRVGKIGSDQSYPALLRAINNPVPMVRHNAINAFIFMNRVDIAVHPVLVCISNPKEEVFVLDSAIALLRLQKDKGNRALAVDGLKKLLAATPHENRKGEIAEAIAALEH